MERSRNPVKRTEFHRQAISLNTRFNTLSDEGFDFVGDWFHFAVMEVIKTKGATCNPDWIAKKIKLLPSQAASALKALEKLQIIEFDENENLKILRDYIILRAENR